MSSTNVASHTTEKITEEGEIETQDHHEKVGVSARTAAFGMTEQKAASSPQAGPIKFVPFSSTVDLSFWVRYTKEKLETIKLSEEPIVLRPSYDGFVCRVQCLESSLPTSATGYVSNERIAMYGELRGFNTSEAFQKVDKNKLLNDFFLPKFFSGQVEYLASVMLLTYADLKGHRVLYWFAFPSFMMRKGLSITAMDQEKLPESYWNLAPNLDSMRRSLLTDGYIGLPSCFIFTSQTCLPLSIESHAALKAKCSSDDEEDGIVFGFFDPSGPVTVLHSEQPMGWPMRNLVAFLSFHLDLGGKLVRILSYRAKSLRRIRTEDVSTASETSTADGILLKVRVPLKTDYEFDEGSNDDKYKVVGWELNARSKPGPRWVNLRPLLDSKHLAVQAADLNLKLMKWRMIPELQVEQLQSTKVLLIGAGTLGCSVARTLLGWGIRHLKFIDYGKVSYSNPVRQNLFTLEDCDADAGNGRPKAAAAAAALSTIAADVSAEGISLSVPMPGHAEAFEAIEAAVQVLDQLVSEADAVFLLTDTRESRWLPTVIAASHDKVLINAALGLDSWLVMRHGGGFSGGAGRLGCYFCNDVVAPENSTRNRTLDQQCTVTRPGLAPIASSMAAELLISLLHHPARINAPAPRSNGGTFAPTVPVGPDAGPLGLVPHQIRGSLVSYGTMTPTVPAFRHCTACAAAVVAAYRAAPAAFVFEACRAPDSAFLEGVSGLAAFRQMEQECDWEDDDEEAEVALEE